MDRIAKLAAIEDIRQLKAKYFRYIDCKLWEQLPSLFTNGMRVITEAGKLYCEGGANYADSLKHSLELAVSCHQGFNAEIEFIDEQHATGIWAMQDRITWPDRHPTQGWKQILGQGHYHETYKMEDGAWRIDTLTLSRLRLDITWPDDDPRSLR